MHRKAKCVGLQSNAKSKIGYRAGRYGSKTYSREMSSRKQAVDHSPLPTGLLCGQLPESQSSSPYRGGSSDRRASVKARTLSLFSPTHHKGEVEAGCPLACIGYQDIYTKFSGKD